MPKDNPKERRTAITQRFQHAIEVIEEQNPQLQRGAIANSLGISQNTFTEIMGNRQNVSPDILQNLFTAFSVNYDYIFQAKEPVIGKKINTSTSVVYDIEPPVYATAPAATSIQKRGKKDMVLPKIVTVDSSGSDNIVYVSVKARAGYLVGYGDKEYIESLPSFRLPGLTNGTFRAFEVEGSSMQPRLRNRDMAIGRWVGSLDEIRENRVHIVVLKDGVVIKRVINRIKERGKLYLKSDTPTNRQDYPILEIDPEDIVEIWYTVGFFSTDLREPEDIYLQLNDLKIEVQEIKKALKR
jgi:transcriptional regulator with XRE-family HTH domain